MRLLRKYLFVLVLSAMAAFYLAACSDSSSVDSPVAGTDTTTDSDADGFTIDDGDCDDTNDAINPDAEEVCDDDIDNNCDGEIDEGCDGSDGGGENQVFYGDSDGDGYGDDGDTVIDTTPPEGYVRYGGDCNDDDDTVYPGAIEVCDDDIDQNCDSIECTSGVGIDTDGDNLTVEQGDCDDSDSSVYPGADEVCDDDIDNNCDGFTDEGCDSDSIDYQVYYIDNDGDGYGNSSDTVIATTAPDGYVVNGGDCNDNDASVHPGAVEICDDSIDQNCDSIECTSTSGTDSDNDGVTVEQGDCDDSDASIYPGAAEVCNDNTDNNCDGFVDEDCDSGGDSGDPADTGTFIQGTVVNGATDTPIQNITVTLTGSAADAVPTTAVTDAQGAYSSTESPGTFTVSVSQSGYNDTSAAGVVIPSTGNGIIVVDFSLVPTSSTRDIATICGKVTDSSGAPVSSAIVSVSGEDASNGIFDSTTTDNNGNYSFRSLVAMNLDNIIYTQLKIYASKDGYNYSSTVISNLASDTTLANVNVTMSAFSGESIVSYDFETDPGFSVSGLWNLHTNSAAAPIMNSAAPTYVTIPSDDATSGQVYDTLFGSTCYWYGDASTGNYLGSQASGDSANSGGTSTAANSGELVTPSIDLSAVTSASLEFKSLFEIEGIDPNDAGYDFMTVEISTDGGTAYTQIAKLNPYIKVYETDRAHLCLSSGGFNKAATWAVYKYDISGYTGGSVKVRFSFDTKDNFYNGFRGWFIDDVRVY